MNRPSTTRTYDDGDDRWEMVDASPDIRLRELVTSYGWWSELTSSFTTRRELAGTTGTLIVNLGSDLEIIDASGDQQWLHAGEGFIAGTAQATSLSRSTGAMSGVHIRAPLTTLARIAAVPLAELTNRVVTLADLPGTKPAQIGERLLDAEAAEARWAVLDQFVAERLAASEPAHPTLPLCLSRLAAGQRVQSLADEIGWSRKQLAQRFQAATGLHPRAFIGLARFERFMNLLQVEPDTELAGAAVAAGYADQAHLTREVRRYAAATPAELRRRLIAGGGGVRD